MWKNLLYPCIGLFLVSLSASAAEIDAKVIRDRDGARLRIRSDETNPPSGAKLRVHVVMLYKEGDVLRWSEHMLHEFDDSGTTVHEITIPETLRAYNVTLQHRTGGQCVIPGNAFRQATFTKVNIKDVAEGTNRAPDIPDNWFSAPYYERYEKGRFSITKFKTPLEKAREAVERKKKKR